MERYLIHLIWGGVALVAVVFGAFVALMTLHVDPSPLTAIVASVVTPIISALFTYMIVRGIKQDTGEIKEKVNGHMSELTAKIPDQPQLTGERNDNVS